MHGYNHECMKQWKWNNLMINTKRRECQSERSRETVVAYVSPRCWFFCKAFALTAIPSIRYHTQSKLHLRHSHCHMAFCTHHRKSELLLSDSQKQVSPALAAGFLEFISVAEYWWSCEHTGSGCFCWACWTFLLSWWVAAAFAAPLFLFSTTIIRCSTQILVSSVLNKASLAVCSINYDLAV